MTENVFCRIWAIEQDPLDDVAHWCHAGAKNLAGGLYPKDGISKKLQETPVVIPRMRWNLVSCEPEYHDACAGCKYLPHKGLLGYGRVTR